MRISYTLIILSAYYQSFAQISSSDSAVSTTFKISASCDNLAREFTHMDKSNNHLNFILVNMERSTTYFTNCDTDLHDIWARSFTSSGDTTFIFSSFTETTNGNKIIAGTRYFSPNYGPSQNKGGFVTCWNNNDVSQWSKKLYIPSSDVSPQQTIALNDGRILCIFSVWSTTAYYSELVCMDEEGNLLWAKKEKELGSMNGFADEKTKNIYLATSNGYVIKLDEDGKVIWSKLFSSDYPYYFKNVIPVSANEIAALGLMDIMKLDTNGNFNWFSHPIISGKGNTSYSPIDLCFVGDSGYVETILITYDGDMWSSYGYGILAVDKNGNLTKAKINFESANSLITLGNKAISSGSNFLCGIDMSAIHSCYSMSDAFDFSYNFETPSIVDQASLIDDNPEIKPFRPLSLQSTSVYFDTVCLVNSYHEVIVSDTSDNGDNTTDTTTTNGDTSSQDSINYSFGVYPNPTHDVLYFTHNKMSDGNGKLSLFDPVGREVLSATIPESNGITTINLQNLPPSVYILRIDYDHQIRQLKIVKD